jgi:glucose/arabinose dehydrogenase
MPGSWNTGHVTGHLHTRAGLRRLAALATFVFVSMLAMPGPLRAADPTPVAPDRGEMFRAPGQTEPVGPRQPRGPAVFGPSGFHETVLFPGLSSPTSIAFAADGRIFIAEKHGRIKVFDSLTDTTPTTYADLQTNVFDYWDRGLLGLALDPAFTTNGRVYVLYTYNHILGDPAPAP